MSTVQDTYFISASEALKVAQQNNYFYINGVKKSTQVCFYSGEKIENAPYNCIHIPLDNLVDFFATTKYRLPTDLNVTGAGLNQEQFDETLKFFTEIMNKAKQLSTDIIYQKSKEVASVKPDFSDSTLRVLIAACRETVVLQNVSKAVAKAFESFENIEVKFFVQDNDLCSCSPIGPIEAYIDFKPHIVFTINHLARNVFGEIDKDVFKFIWYQDFVSKLIDDTVLELEEREYIFSLIPEFDKLLDKKNLPYQRQSFCINEDVFQVDESIQREKKIVFIGSSYGRTIKDNTIEQDLLNELISNFNEGVLLEENLVESLVQKYNIEDAHYLRNRVIPFIVRDLSVIWLCSIESDYEIEVYGNGWEYYEAVKPFHKGVIDFGKDLSTLYNSATYTLAPHPLYFLQQRTLEAVACGCIPILYDIRGKTDEVLYNESVEYFTTQEDLANILSSKVVKKDFTRILKDNSYVAFSNKMLDIVKNSLDSDNEILDTYFLNPTEALKVAKQQNKLYRRGVIESKQVCYYSGEEFVDAPYNCVHVPLDTMLEFFARTKHRLPKAFNQTGCNLTQEQLNETTQSFKEILNASISLNKKLIEEKTELVKKMKPNFNDKRWRVFIPACRETTVIKNTAKALANAFEGIKEIDVVYYIPQSDTYSCNALFAIEAFLEFNPHIIVLTNHFVDDIYCSDGIFKFSWFQDFMPEIDDKKPKKLGDREYIYSLVKEIDVLLDMKGINYKRQSFCLNEDTFFKNDMIDKAKKVVFIGSSYGDVLDMMGIPQELMDELVLKFNNGNLVNEENILSIINRYGIDRTIVETRLIFSIVREVSVLWLCSIRSDYKVEVYGKGWQKYDAVKPFYKGMLKYGQELRDVYNSATYILAPHSLHIMQQRTLEAAACDAIPIVYDVRDATDEPLYDEAVEYYKTQNDLARILSFEPKNKDFTRLLRENSYLAFANKILNVVQSEL